jgi:hypothetical protein
LCLELVGCTLVLMLLLVGIVGCILVLMLLLLVLVLVVDILLLMHLHMWSCWMAVPDGSRTCIIIINFLGS